MSNKKFEVVELNKEEEKIILEEQQSNKFLFWKKYNKLILMLLLIVSLTVLGISLFITISNLPTSDKIVIKEVSVDTNISLDAADITASLSAPLTDKNAQDMFMNNKTFKSKGEVLLVKTVSKKGYIIKFYSDYTAIRILKNAHNGDVATRINSIDGKSYGIKENGVTNSKAEISDVKQTNTKEYSWGTVIYYSDGSAEITNSKMDMYVRDAKDIEEKFISNNKVSYLKKIDNIGGIKINYYYDGTIEVIQNNKSYIVRDEEDLIIDKNTVAFKNNNEATVKEEIKLANGQKIYYYTDGGAIIKDGNKILSVRKSNSIVIKDNKIYEIVDNIYVTVSKEMNNKNIIYYTNGSAVIKNYNGQTIYVKENSDIKLKDGQIIDIGNDYEVLTEERNLNNDRVAKFETIAVVETKDYIAIVPKDSILYDTDGSLKDIVTSEPGEENKPITITNNTNDIIKYRIVIEKSARTTLDVEYIKYQLSVGDEYIKPTKLDTTIWIQDKVSESLSITGINYILLEKTLEPQATDKIKLMLWTDYDTIPNSMQNKYFYGTIRIYAWQEIDLNI